MRRFALAALGSLALGAAVPAQAADMPIPVKGAPPAFVHAFYNWTGWYIGANVGYGFGDLSNPFLGGTGFSPSGMTYGLQGGFNYQMGSWVFGIEGEYNWADMKDTVGVVGLASGEAKIDQIYNISGRVGYAFDRTLIYGKFGYAWTQEEYNFTAVGGTATGSADRNGWLFGAGIEYAFWGNWTAKIEYNYFDMGSKLITLATTGGLVVVPANVDLTVQTVKLGINYKFNWGRW